MAKVDSVKADVNKKGVKNKKKPAKKFQTAEINKKATGKTVNAPAKSNAATFVITIVVVSVIVGGGIYLWQNNVSRKNINQAKEEENNLITNFFQKRISEIENKLQGIESENVELKTENEELGNKAKLLDEAKKQFINKELDIAFLYPAIFGEVSMTIDDGETGKIFRGGFSNNNKLSFGGVSQDFSRSATTTLINILDTYGFKKRLTGYYFKYVSEQAITDYKIEPLNVIKSKTSVVLVNKDSFVFDQENEGQTINLGENYLAGLVNLEGDIFGGLAFFNQDVENFSLIEFGAMMETVEVE